VSQPDGFKINREGAQAASPGSRRSSRKVGIGIAVVLGALYATVFAVDFTKGQTSPRPETLQVEGIQNIEVIANSPSLHEDTIPRDSQQNTVQTASSPLLFADISLAKNPVSIGEVQTITVTVSDGTYKLYRASVEGTITYASGAQKHFSGTTDATGQVVYSWEIESNSAPGAFWVDVNVSSGDQSGLKQAGFEVTSAL
jgi:hypothetical protein